MSRKIFDQWGNEVLSAAEIRGRSRMLERMQNEATCIELSRQNTELRARLAELQEAVRWLLECEELFGDKCIFYMNTWWEFELYTSITAARAAVDALIGDGVNNAS